MTACLASDDIAVMGVVNMTPDSFSDGGRYLDPAKALDYCKSLQAAGADIVDIGGESTAPGSKALSVEIEQQRILQTVRVVSREMTVSVDTFRAETARAVLEAGATIINDVSGLRAEPQLADHVAAHDATLVIMHSKEAGDQPHASDRPAVYTDIIENIADFLSRQTDKALATGIPRKNIWLDPGWGRFLSLQPEATFEVLARFNELVAQFPDQKWVVAASRKGFLGVDDTLRDAISQQVAMVAIDKGASVIRTHDVSMARAFLKTRQSVLRFTTNEI